jgi:hypothetical protein
VANTLHREIVEALLDAGKHVLCEKPLAPSVADGQAMVDRATKHDRVAAVGFTFRRSPGRRGPVTKPLHQPREETAMKLGAYTACLHDRSLPETLKILQEMGLTSAEINAGGFIPAPHLPIEQLLSGATSPGEYLGLFEQAGITLTGLNVNGNPLNPDPEQRPGFDRGPPGKGHQPVRVRSKLYREAR